MISRNRDHSPKKEASMSEQQYEELWHYSEQFTRDPLQRSELVTMAWKEGLVSAIDQVWA